VNRGNITIWFSEESISKWQEQTLQCKTRGRPCKYSDTAIECGLTFRSLYRLPLRATQGFLEGMIQLLGVNIPCPDYTTLSRRASKLEIDLNHLRDTKNGNRDLVIDSSGLKVYGEGEWKMKIHGKQKRRTWRKLHIAMDPNSHQTVSMSLTEGNVHDSQAVPALLLHQAAIKDVYADDAYGFKNCFDTIASIKANAMIAVRSGTALAKNPSLGLIQRNKIVVEMWRYGGREAWKKKSGYHKRSLVENQFYRYKTVFGEKLQAREFKNQDIEARLKLSLLNRMTQLGMPEYTA